MVEGGEVGGGDEFLEEGGGGGLAIGGGGEGDRVLGAVYWGEGQGGGREDAMYVCMYV